MSDTWHCVMGSEIDDDELRTPRTTSCTDVDEQGLDCVAPEGHEPPHANVNGGWADDPEVEPFDPATMCHGNPEYTGTDDNSCPHIEPCKLRCHVRWLDGQIQANDDLADSEQAASWRRYYDANPGAEAAMKAACDPKTYEKRD